MDYYTLERRTEACIYIDTKIIKNKHGARESSPLN